MSATMQAVVYDRPREITVRDVPVPEPGPGHVRVRMLLAGVCGTDLHLHAGEFMAAWPMTPGHEMLGTVDALGEGVDAFTIGQQVVVNPNLSCGVCDYCREGRRLLCESLRGLGTTDPGGFAELVVAREGAVFDATGIDPDTAVFTEPLSCVVHGVEVLRPLPGTSALVVGSGPTGLLLAQLVKASGAAHVTVASPVATQLRRADELGIDATFEMDRGRLPQDVESLRELGGGGFDAVIDATGVARVLEAIVPLARRGGTVMCYGVANEADTVSISPYDVFRRELRIQGSFASVDSFAPALALLRTGRVRTDGLITHRFPIADYAAALEAVRSDDTAHKVVIVP